jgi:predicted metal-dependent peptidase
VSDIKDQITQDKFNKILVKFLLMEPFFSTIIRHMHKEKTNMIPTAGVTIKDSSIYLYWNPEFVSSLPVKKIFGLLKHECYHLIFKHITSRKQEPHLMWNIATDLAINSIIPLDELPEGGLVPGEFPVQKSTHLNEKMSKQAEKMGKFIASLPKNKASEWYMEKLMSDPDIQKAAESCYGNSGFTGMDVHIDPEDLSDADRELLDGKMRQVVKQAAEKANSNNTWGSVPINIRSEILIGCGNTVDWKKTLHYFCGNKQRLDKSRTFRRINRKYPYIHPGRKIKRTSNLAIYIDQSGSVGNDDIALFFGALNDLAKNVSFNVYHFDTNVDDNSAYKWNRGKKFKFPNRTCYGGTCFDCVEDHFRKVMKNYDGYIIMTDGCAPKPKSCISKRCWVLLPGYDIVFKPDKRDSMIKMKPN